MDETTREQIIAELKKRYEGLANFKESEARFEELKVNPVVKEFLELQSFVKDERNRHRFLYIEYKDVDHYIQDNIPYKMESLKCNHDLVMYAGSYTVYRDEHGVLMHERLKGDETHPDFVHNGYTCLCCGNPLYPEDYEKFESERNVLKNYDLYFDRTEMHNAFCRLLASMSYEDAVNYITDYYNGFNDGAKLVRKKNED